jgi:hypothetical protein
MPLGKAQLRMVPAIRKINSHPDHKPDDKPHPRDERQSRHEQHGKTESREPARLVGFSSRSTTKTSVTENPQSKMKGNKNPVQSQLEAK